MPWMPASKLDSDATVRLLAARPHAFAQEVRIERRERNDHDDGENLRRPKAWDGEQAPGGSFIKYWLIHTSSRKKRPRAGSWVSGPQTVGGNVNSFAGK